MLVPNRRSTAPSPARDSHAVSVASIFHLREGGMSKVTFAFGVVNAFATVFVIGRWPEHYW